MKMKEFGPPGGARPWRPTLDPPLFNTTVILFQDTTFTSEKIATKPLLE